MSARRLKAVCVLLLFSMGRIADSNVLNESVPSRIKPRTASVFDEPKAAVLRHTSVTVATGQLLASNSRFFAEVLSDNVASAGGSFPSKPGVNLLGRIRVAPEDVGQRADILLVATYQGAWYMRTLQGWQAWDQQLQTLAAVDVPHTLAAIEDVDIATSLTLSGDFSIFLGYRRQGLIQYSRTPLQFSLVAATTTVLSKFNDTGITACANAYGNKLACPQGGYPSQDAESGRDATHNDDSDGHAGFSFTKISSTGAVLPASASSWSCVQDNVTGLMWEVKTDDNGLHDKDWSYTWYEPDNAKNGGNAGEKNGGNCGSTSTCDTYGYVQAVNATGWCGKKDWRMPARGELRGIVSLDRFSPAIDTIYFPNTASESFWSSSSYVSYVSSGWGVDFYYGGDGANSKGSGIRVRLVRIGQ